MRSRTSSTSRNSFEEEEIDKIIGSPSRSSFVSQGSISSLAETLRPEKAELSRQSYANLKSHTVRICDIVQRITSGKDCPDTESILETLDNIKSKMETGKVNQISFSGEKESFIQATTIGNLYARPYTLCIWISPDGTGHSKGFLLFRCKSALGIVDTIFSDKKADGNWTVTLKISSDSGGVTEKQEFHKRVTLEHQQYNFLVFQHTNVGKVGMNRLMLSLNGSVVIQEDLSAGFPTIPKSAANLSQLACQWILCLGFRGSMASASLYGEDLTQAVTDVFMKEGPHSRSSAAGVSSIPQYSFDSGHMVLGSRVGKGSRAMRLCRLPLLFHLNALSVSDVNGRAAVLPNAVVAGRLNAEHTEMMPPSSASSNGPHNVAISGNTTIDLGATWPNAWLNEGGTALILYMLWGIVAKDDFPGTTCVNSSLAILATLLRLSPECKEQFIQIHGFHLVAACLGRLRDKLSALDADVVDQCCALLDSLGDDGEQGDGVAAALQGLLLNFRVWGHTSPAVKLHLILRLIDIFMEKGEILYKNIGVQKILDIMRLYILRKGEDNKEDAESIADAGCRLLGIAIDAAIVMTQKTHLKFHAANEIDAILRCLEETASSLLAERTLRVLSRVRIAAPGLLRSSLSSVRFAETSLVTLLSQKGFSAEVRREALTLGVWSLREELQFKPAALVAKVEQLMGMLSQLPYEAAVKLLQKADPKEKQHSRSKSSGNNQYVDHRAINEVKVEIQLLLQPLERVWRMLTMLSEVMRKAIEDDAWSLQQKEKEKETSAHGALLAPKEAAFVCSFDAKKVSASTVGVVDSVLSIFFDNGPIGSRMEFWVFLPLLSSLLSTSSLSTCQQVIMSMIVALKTDEMQLDIFCNMPEKVWISVLLKVALQAERHSARLAESELSAHSRNERGDSLADTCIELSIDALATLMDHKMRNYTIVSVNAWTCLQSCMKELVTAIGVEGQGLERKVLRRLVSLILQKLGRVASSEKMDIALVNTICKLFEYVDSSNLILSEPKSGKRTAAVADGESASPSKQLSDLPTQSLEEENLMIIMFEVAASLKKVGGKGFFDGHEHRPIMTSLQLALRCLPSAGSTAADKICTEVIGTFQYLLIAKNKGKFMVNSDEFKSTIMGMFGKLRDSIQRPETVEDVKGRYCALVYLICHQFIELRHSLAEKGALPEHILPTLDAMTGIDTCNDVDIIFKLLDVTMSTASAICFDDVEILGDEQAADAAENNSMLSLKLDQQSQQSIHFEADLLDLGESEATPRGRTGSAGSAGSEVERSIIAGEEEMSAAGKAMADTQGAGNPASLDGFASPDSNGRRDRAPSTHSADVPTGSISSEAASADTRKSVSDDLPSFKLWLETRRGIVLERVDSERFRLSRSMQSLDLGADALDKFWRRLRRKIEIECIHVVQQCQWKLGIAHEGPFPGRKRLVLRPRFEWTVCGPHPLGAQLQLEANAAADKDASRDDGEVPADEADSNLRSSIIDGKRVSAQDNAEWERALAKAVAGYIQDVTRVDDSADALADSSATSETVDTSSQASASAAGASNVGSGWGLVGADDSEEGFGVIGLATEGAGDLRALDSTSAADSGAAGGGAQPEGKAENAGQLSEDMQGDIKLIEDALQQGRGGETGPCHSGTRRISSGAPVISCRVIMVTASGNFWGTLTLAEKDVYFVSSFEANDGHKDDSAAVNLVQQLRLRRRRWTVSSTSAVYLRRYRLRDTAMEVFFRRGKHRHFFVDFGHTREDSRNRIRFARALMESAPGSAFKQWPTLSPYRLVTEHHGIQDRWINGEMSNFEYLMALNTIAGRSFNDLCQYPVMPWVIGQYTEPTINLQDPATYRDLSKPMGAVNPVRLAEFLERYESFDENMPKEIPPFMYGSHYSTMVGVVLHFLVRMQPFAALHIEMQNGHFDVPDRLFASIPRTYYQNTTQLSEVKELTPEWFTTPEMFRNVNNFNFGKTQEGSNVGDVELPPWASSPEEFVRINREALESDYVSAHLHEWIDLIFGYKQKGPAAVEAHNVFYYLTYAGSVDREMIKDEELRKATELQIAHFGQVPLTLFRAPHPARRVIQKGSSELCPRPLRRNFIVPASYGAALSLVSTQFATPKSDEEDILADAPAALLSRGFGTSSSAMNPKGPGSGSSVLGNVIVFAMLTDRVVCVVDTGVIEVYRFSTAETAKSALVQHAAAVNRARAKASKSSRIVNQQFEDLAYVEPSSGGSYDEVEETEELVQTLVEEKKKLMRAGRDLFCIEKDLTHFDVLPRIPVCVCVPKSGKDDMNFPVASADLHAQHREAIVHFSAGSSLVFSAGTCDGLVFVREIDTNTGFIASAGEFTAHRSRVIALSTDFIPGGNTEVIASCDCDGQILVWTVSRTRLNINTPQQAQQPGAANGNAKGNPRKQPEAASAPAPGQRSYSYVISRRPQRLFRTEPGASTAVALSWQMGVLIASSDTRIRMFSIERDEMLRVIDVSPTLGLDTSSSRHLKKHDGYCGHSSTLIPAIPLNAARGSTGADAGASDLLKVAASGEVASGHVAGVLFSNDGLIIVHEIAAREGDMVSVCHFLAVYSLSGHELGRVALASAITYFDCPARGEFVLCGFVDGTVSIFSAHNVELIYQFKPHMFSVHMADAVIPLRVTTKDPKAGGAKASGSAGGSGSEGGSDLVSSSPLPSAASPSPIVCVRLGPNPSHPTLICATTAAGELYFKALPDFIRWERTRNPSALAQLVSAPVNAIKGTIQTAQNILTSTTETVDTFAQNARSFADDAMGELRKIKKGQVLKTMGSYLFGGGSKK